MISLQDAKTPADTLEAYDKITAIRKELLAGADFAALAKEKSEDPSAMDNAGYLGWFHAFKMVYPFERAAYKTPVGGVSPILKTQFGYHVLKTLNKRKSRGEVQVAHIILTHKQADSTIDPEARMREIYQKLQQGESFENLALKYSDDRQSAVQGGVINRFAAGQLRSSKFEDMAFSLLKPGDYSKPFKTELGWHLIKLVQKFPIESLQQMRPELEARIKNDSRSKLVEDALLAKLNKIYTVKEGGDVVMAFAKINPTTLMQGKWQMQLPDTEQVKPALIIEKDTLTYNDFSIYVKQAQRAAPNYANARAFLDFAYSGFKSKSLKEYYRSHLAENNMEYAQIIKEYEEGILLFALMEEKIWNRAKVDTMGLHGFFDANRDNYRWPVRYRVLVASSPNEKSAEEALKMLKQQKAPADIKKQLNKDGLVNVFFTQKTVTADDSLLPQGYIPQPGLNKIYKNDDFSIVLLEEEIPATAQEFDEIKGKVINDYQNKLEQEWLSSLENGHKVTVDKQVFEAVKKELSH